MNIINGLHFNNVRGDMYGGLTAAVVALPLAMAMGVASGAGAIAGMYGAIFVGFFAALFGGTPSQVSGPTGPMTVVMAIIFTQYTSMFPDNLAHGTALAFTVVVMGGIFQIIMGFLRIGKYIELVPHPVVSGFMTGIGVIIILLQFGPIVGHESVSKPIEAALSIPYFLQNIETTSLILGVVALLIVYSVPPFFPALNRLMPSPLLALIVGTLCYVFFMDAGATPIIGDIPTGFPALSFPIIDPELMIQMLVSGLTLAALGTIDSLLTSLVADNMTRSQHKSDRELIGQGIGNTLSGLFGGLPGAGATMRTVVNINAGGRTPLSGALHAVILLAVVLGAGTFASDIPKAVLAGILIKVGTDIIDWDYLKRLTSAPASGVIIMFTVLLVTVAIDLLLAVGIGMVMASFLFMHRVTQHQIDGIEALTNASDAAFLSDDEVRIMDDADGKILLFHLCGPMSFSSAKAMIRRHASMVDYDVMILDLSDVPFIDFTTARSLDDIVIDTKASGRKIFISGARGRVYEMLSRQRVFDKVSSDEIQENRIDALQLASANLP